MAKTKGPQHRWKKGQSGNPNGRPVLPPEVKRLLKFTSDELKEMISVLLYSTTDELVLILKDPSQPALKKIMASILTRAEVDGSMSQLDMVLNRVIGKVKEDIDLRVNKPTMLVRRNGEVVEFSHEPAESEEE